MSRHTTGSIRFFKFSEMRYVQAVRAEDINNDFLRHIHRTYCVGIIDEGARKITTKERSVIIPAGSLFVLNPGLSHRCQSFEHKPHSYRVLCLSMRFIKSLAEQIAQPMPYFPDLIISDDEILTSLNEFFIAIEEKKSVLEREEVILSLCSRLIIKYAQAFPFVPEINRGQSLVASISDYIEKNYTKELSLTKLASQACLSPFHFHRLFLKELGISPHDYLIQFRIKKAQELLLDGVDIIEVALETGFADQSHFSRYFKKIVGVSPGNYQTMNKDVKVFE